MGRKLIVPMSVKRYVKSLSSSGSAISQWKIWRKSIMRGNVCVFVHKLAFGDNKLQV